MFVFVFFFDYFCFLFVLEQKFSVEKTTKQRPGVREKRNASALSKNTIFVVIFVFFFIHFLYVHTDAIYFTWSFQFDAIFHIISLHRSAQPHNHVDCSDDALGLGHERQSSKHKNNDIKHKGTNKTH